MVARGEVALVAASLGLKSGAIDTRLFSAAVLVALASTIITPVALGLWAKRPSIPGLSDVAAPDAALALVANPVERK
jgi:Kef-type K+ transport system membrane component KefB